MINNDYMREARREYQIIRNTGSDIRSAVAQMKQKYPVFDVTQYASEVKDRRNFFIYMTFKSFLMGGCVPQFFFKKGEDWSFEIEYFYSEIGFLTCGGENSYVLNESAIDYARRVYKSIEVFLGRDEEAVQAEIDCNLQAMRWNLNLALSEL